MPSPVDRPTAALAQFCSDLRWDQLPDSVVRQARSALLNHAACSVAGSAEPVVSRVWGALSRYAASGDTSVVGYAPKVDPITASFVNGLSSAVLTFDDTHARTVVHPIGPVAAAAIAACEERRLGGREFLEALVAGVDVVCRTSMAISSPPAMGAIGWSQTGVCGAMGAAAAVAKLIGLDAVAIRNAIALGANAGSGLRAMHGSMAVVISAANAAGDGYRAASLAEAGVAGAPTILEHPNGFVALFAQQGALQHLTDGLGTRYEISETNFKPYPCGIVAHAAIDAARAARSSPNFAAADVREVRVRVPSTCVSLGDRPVVVDENEASVSIQYWVASALLTDNLGPDCLRTAWLKNADREQLQTRVRLVADDTLSRQAAHVTARLTSGMEIEGNVADCRGSNNNPLTPEDVENKFADAVAGRLDRRRIQEVIMMCRRIEDVYDLRDFTKLLQYSAAIPK